MPLDLDPLEQRLVGVLIEKETTVPETYPLTVNALVAGSNQKSNRDPEMKVQDYEIEGALKSLLHKGWALEHEKDGGRVRRYAHQAGEQLGVGKAELAILAELLLRGPQTPTELKTRCERMTPVGGAPEVERRLEEMAARPVPYVKQLPLRPRERDRRWEHLLGRRAEIGEAASSPAASPSTPAPGLAPPFRAAERPERGGEPQGSPPSRAGPTPRTDSDGELERLRDLVETLEQRVLELEDRLRRLEGR